MDVESLFQLIRRLSASNRLVEPWVLVFLLVLAVVFVGLLRPRAAAQPELDHVLPEPVTETVAKAEPLPAKVVVLDVVPPLPVRPRPARQPWDAFLVLDVEGTCKEGTDFNWPNEIIEFPVCLMRWHTSDDGKRSELRVDAEFRSFVRPTWNPQLTAFCTQLTGITQAQVNAAPAYPTVMSNFAEFLEQNGLIDPETGRRLVRFCWCSDGPWDIRDFCTKQFFISNMAPPEWIQGDFFNVRKAVTNWHIAQTGHRATGRRPPSLNISRQLHALGLPPFEGRQHSGIDDARNIARIVAELARKDVRIVPNDYVDPGRRWPWMGKRGQVLEEYVYCAAA